MTYRYSKHNINELFLQLLPVQIFSYVTTSLSGIVNGIFIGRHLSNLDMVSLGLVNPLTAIISVISTIISSGAGIICGEYMGKGERDKISKAFSVSIFTLIGSGIILTAACLLFAEPIANVLGADALTLNTTTAYIRGISFGILPMIISPCLMVFLQMENEPKYALLSTVVLAVSNFVLDTVGIKYLNVDIFGVGILTSISQLIAMYFLRLRFIKVKTLPRLVKTKDINLCKEIIFIGLPSALGTVLYAIRNTVINNYANHIGGNDAVNALSIVFSSCGPLDAINKGVTSTHLMLVSIYVGEKDRDAIKQLNRTALSYGLILAFSKMMFIFVFAYKIALLYGASNVVAEMTEKLYICYSLTMPLNIIASVTRNTHNVLKRVALCNMLCVLTCIVAPLGMCFIGSSFLGINAIWNCYWFAEVAVILAVYIVACIHKRGMVYGFGDLLYIEEDLDLEISKTISIREMKETVNVSKEIELFCSENNIDKKRCMIASLCCEEITTNIVQHGFPKSKKKNKTIDIYVGIKEDKVNIRIKDNAAAFNPYTKIHNSDDPSVNVGIKLVSKIAKKMDYQNYFGLNVLTIKL